MRIFDITLTSATGSPAGRGTPSSVRLGLVQGRGGDGQRRARRHLGPHRHARRRPGPRRRLRPGRRRPGTHLGPARVADVRGRAVIRVEDLAALDLAGTPRLLPGTDGWADRSRFPDAIPVLHRDVPGYLEAAGVILLGLDVPSVDALDSKDLPVHHALFRSRIAILESVDLSGVALGASMS